VNEVTNTFLDEMKEDKGEEKEEDERKRYEC